MSPLTRRSRLAGLAALASVAALAPASSALAAPAGQLDWTMQNNFGPAGTDNVTANVNRTWLGYVTNPTPGAGARGTATPSGAAFGPIVAPTSLRGTNVWGSFGYALDATETATGVASGANDLQYDGVVSFVSPAPPAGHGFTFTLEDPQIVFNTTTATGQLFATGTTTQGRPAVVGPYDRTKAVFNLDFSKATYNVYADGSTVVSCIIPSVAETNYAIPSYAAGAGPDRTPNTFGTFAIRIGDGIAAPSSDWADSCAPKDGADGAKGDTGAVGAPGPVGPQGGAGPVGAPGPVGPKGATGARGKQGKTGKQGKRGPRGRVVVRRASLARAAFAGTKARTVKVTRRGSKAVVATGTVKGRTLTYKATKKLTGKLVLRAGGRAVTVTVK